MSSTTARMPVPAVVRRRTPVASTGVPEGVRVGVADTDAVLDDEAVREAVALGDAPAGSDDVGVEAAVGVVVPLPVCVGVPVGLGVVDGVTDAVGVTSDGTLKVYEKMPNEAVEGPTQSPTTLPAGGPASFHRRYRAPLLRVDADTSPVAQPVHCVKNTMTVFSRNAWPRSRRKPLPAPLAELAHVLPLVELPSVIRLELPCESMMRSPRKAPAPAKLGVALPTPAALPYATLTLSKSSAMTSRRYTKLLPGLMPM